LFETPQWRKDSLTLASLLSVQPLVEHWQGQKRKAEGSLKEKKKGKLAQGWA
jgi:hypothetical protein